MTQFEIAQMYAAALVQLARGAEEQQNKLRTILEVAQNEAPWGGSDGSITSEMWTHLSVMREAARKFAEAAEIVAYKARVP